MMKKIDYIMLDRADHPDWNAITGLFTRMYDRMDEMGLMVPLTEGGTEKWLKTARNTSGKFGIVVLARDGAKEIGFAHGIMKFLPDYLGGYAVGSITHVFVDEQARRAGVGKHLVQELEAWFHLKKVQSVELQVIAGNHAAQDFWKEIGYREELLQYRKISQP